MEILNEDWVGEDVWSIDDARVPDAIRRHGERFRNPARYAIEVNPDEFALYGVDGELGAKPRFVFHAEGAALAILLARRMRGITA